MYRYRRKWLCCNWGNDSDGVNDYEDQCQGTLWAYKSMILVVLTLTRRRHANVDNCPDSPAKWTIDEQGCAVVQTLFHGVQPHLSLDLCKLFRTFLCRHLMGRFIFSKNGLGTTSTISSSNIPIRMETQILQLGAESWNIHSLIAEECASLYGSFDATYHNDVIERKMR